MRATRASSIFSLPWGSPDLPFLRGKTPRSSGTSGHRPHRKSTERTPEMGKPPTRHQLDMALAAISQVSGFLTDGGLDSDGSRAASLAAASESLELVRKHWTTETRRKADRPAESNTASLVDGMSADHVNLVSEGQDKPAARNAPDPERLTDTLSGRGGQRETHPQSRN